MMVNEVKTPTKVNYSKGKDKYLIATMEYFFVKTFLEGFKQSEKELQMIDAYFKKKQRAFSEHPEEPPSIETLPSVEVVPEQSLNWYSAYAIYLAGVFEQAILDNIQGTVKTSIEEGLHIQDIVKKLQNDASYDGFTTNRLHTIARTESTKAYNSGRLEQYKSRRGFVEALQYSAILDKRTTPLCRGLHGKIMAIDSPLISVYLPPNHFNCRSILLPITRYEDWTEDDFSKVEKPQDGFDNPQWTPVNKLKH